MPASATFIKVKLISFSGTKSLFTMAIDAFVVYKKLVYLGLDKKVNDPFFPSSILDSVETSTLGSPTISPSKISAICVAVNFIVCKSKKTN